MSNDAQQPQDGLPEGTALPAAAKPTAAAPATTDRRGFLQSLAAIGVVAGVEAVLPGTTAKAEPIRTPGGAASKEKVDGQYRDRPIVSAMQYTPHPTDASQLGGIKEVRGRLVGNIDDSTLSKEQIATIKAQMPPFEKMVAVYIDVDGKADGDEVIAWMYEADVKKEEACMCKSRQSCGVRCGDAYVGTYTPEFTRQPQFTLIQDIDIDVNVQVEQAAQQPWFPQYCTCGNGRTYAINGYMGFGSGYPGLYAYNCPMTRQRRYFCHNNQVSRYRRLFGGGSFSGF